MKKKLRASTLLALTLCLYLLPNAILNVVVTLSGHKITMYYDDYKAQEKAISSAVAAGTSVQHAKQIMWMNGFACAKQTSTLLQFDKNDGWWPTYEGFEWTVQMGLKQGFTSKVTKVCIGPND